MVLIGILIIVYIYFIKKTENYTDIIDRIKRENDITLEKEDTTEVVDVK